MDKIAFQALAGFRPDFSCTNKVVENRRTQPLRQSQCSRREVNQTLTIPDSQPDYGPTTTNAGKFPARFLEFTYFRKLLLITDPDNPVGGGEIAQPNYDRYAANDDAGDDYDLEQSRGVSDGRGFFRFLPTNRLRSLRPSRKDPLNGIILIGITLLMPGLGILLNPAAHNSTRNVRSSHIYTTSH